MTKPVTAAALRGPYSRGMFNVLLEARYETKTERRIGKNARGILPIAGELPQRQTRIGALTTAAQSLYNDGPLNFGCLEERCIQFQRFIRSRGIVPEPEWRAWVGTLFFGGPAGEDLAHNISRGDPRYSQEETQAKGEYWVANADGPATCAHFESLNPSHCASCPLRGKITTPLQIARGQAPEAERPQLAEGANAGHIISSDLSKATSHDEPKPSAKLADGYRKDMDGRLVHCTESNNGKANDVTVCNSYVVLKAVLKNETDEREKLAISHDRFNDGKEALQVIDPIENLGSSVREQMWSRGIVVHEAELFRKWMRAQQQPLERTAGIKTCYDSFGLKGKSSFLYGDRLYTPDGIEPAWGSNELIFRSRLMTPPAGASLEKWVALAAKFFRSGMEGHVTILLCGFAGVLMKVFSSIDGGCIVAFISPETAMGKSTILAAVQSIWGSKQLDLSKRDTANSRFKAMAAMGNLTVTFDEFRCDENTRDFVEAYYASQDKMRLDSSGSNIKHPPSGWANMLIVTGNRSPFDYLLNFTEEKTDAPAVRIMEFRAQLYAEAKMWDGDALREEMFANASTAGDAFLKHIFCTPGRWAETQERLKAELKIIVQGAGWNNKARFFARALAAAKVAGDIAHEIGLIPEKPDRYIEWAVAQQTLNLDYIERFGGTTTIRSLNAVIQMLHELQLNTLVIKEDGAMINGHAVLPQAEPRGPLFIRRETNSGRAYVSEEAFGKWMSGHGYTSRNVMVDMSSEKVILGRFGVDLGRGTNFACGVMPCVAIDLKHPLVSGKEAQNDQPEGFQPVGATSLSRGLH